MAVDDNGKQARLLPCLAILRYTVATVVTVLAVVVIVMVISVGVRPDDVSVSVVHGHVGTSDLWNKTTTYVVAERIYGRPVPGSCIGRRHGAQNSELISSCSSGTYDDYNIGAGGTYWLPPTRTVYTPVDVLSLVLALSVDNRSGRGSIYCRSINVTFLDDGGTSTAPGIVIGELNLTSSFNFQAEPQTSHKISRVLHIVNETVLTYIANTYGGESSFTGVVEVTMNTSFVVFGHHTSPRIVTFVCSPVDFSVGEATATASSVQCTKSN